MRLFIKAINIHSSYGVGILTLLRGLEQLLHLKFELLAFLTSLHPALRFVEIHVGVDVMKAIAKTLTLFER